MASCQQDVEAEAQPLLSPSSSTAATAKLNHVKPDDPLEGAALHRSEGDDASHAEAYDDVPKAKRQLGQASAVFLIFNRVIGTGIYATPSLILRSAGSVGGALVMWLLAAAMAGAGTAVYIELGTGLPRSGGEKNYLEFIYRRPKFLVACMFGTYAMFIGSCAANGVVFGEYVAHALALSPTSISAKLFAVIAVTFALVLHSTSVRWGIRVQNTLGAFKIFVLAFISLAGILSLMGVPGFEAKHRKGEPFRWGWEETWKGTFSGGANVFVGGMYTTIWSFIGYSNANYALSEVRDPARTLKRAAPLAMLGLTIVYFLVNVAYFSVVSQTEILEGKRVVAALFFRNLFGDATERVLSATIALSVLGNILAVLFTTGRVIQELGREGTVPLSRFFSSNWPFNAPFAGLCEQWLVSCAYMVLTPSGDAYLFMLNISSYPFAIINTALAAGLFLLRSAPYKVYNWDPPYSSPATLVFAYLLANIFLAVVPLVPPEKGKGLYEHLPYWSHVCGAVILCLIGFLYWFVWSIWLPRRRGYRLVREMVRQDDGVSRNVFMKIDTLE